MRNNISKRLAPLASLAAQRRYIVHGCSDEYLIPSELLDSAVDVARKIRNMPVIRYSLSAEGLEALLNLDGMIEADGQAYESVRSDEVLIEQDTAWKAVREQAARCLETIGSDLRDWERRQGLT